MSSSSGNVHPLLDEIRDKNTGLTPTIIKRLRRANKVVDAKIAEQRKLRQDFRNEIWRRICAEHPCVYEFCAFSNDGYDSSYSYHFTKEDADAHYKRIERDGTYELAETKHASGTTRSLMIDDVLSKKLVLK